MKYLLIQLPNLIQVNSNRYSRCEQNDTSIIQIQLIVPEADTENYEEVEWAEDLTTKKDEDVGTLDDHCTDAVAVAEVGGLLICKALVGVGEEGE